jgi:hypothetical protein
MKTLSGLKQAKRAWYAKIDQFLWEQGMIRSASDCNLYYCIQWSLYAIVVLYVDDLLMIGNYTQKLYFIENNLEHTRFEMSKLGTEFVYRGRICLPWGRDFSHEE